MGSIHMGHERGLAESWQRDRGLHENGVRRLRLLAERLPYLDFSVRGTPEELRAHTTEGDNEMGGETNDTQI